ncbi:MAG: sulfoxide reductase heme-binding subunit YedZ [Alphaproteobacteria bacterium]|nr:sulfoxide reductase heme-binding subunit YedZ [Alphaproteobacteria bacterium]
MRDAPSGSAKGAAQRRLRPMPWLDNAGRFSPFKLTVLVLLALPAAFVAYEFAGGELGPRPINAALHEIGNWSLRLILISLAIRPGRAILQWPQLMQIRRMAGVAAFVYAASHLLLYAADEAFDLQKVALEIAFRIYLTIGFAALLVLTAMAVTSTDGMVRRLGAKRWRRLHQLVYGAALLGVIHFFMQVKANVDEPWVMAGLFAWLMLYRLAARLRKGRGGLPEWLPAALAAGAGIATALGESVYYWVKLGVAPAKVLAVNFTFATGPRPALIATAICLAFVLAGIARRRLPLAVRRPAEQS